jgi:hypothetical protein
MNAIVRYLAGGALALSSQGFFAVSFGLSGAMSTGAEPLPMVRLQDVQPAATKMVASLQQVDRTHKGDRLLNPNAAPGPVTMSNEFVANEPAARKPGKPLAKPVKRDIEPKLPEGCSASVSPLSDRIAANQASNCITALELPFKVASAE